MDTDEDNPRLVSLGELPVLINIKESADGPTNRLQLIGVVWYKGDPINLPEQGDVKKMYSGGHYIPIAYRYNRWYSYDDLTTKEKFLQPKTKIEPALLIFARA